MSLLQKRKWVGSRLLQHAIILALPGGFSAANGTGLQQVYLLVKLLRVLQLHAGTGKTATVSEQLKGMDSDALSYTTVNLNSFTDAPSLQPILEQPLEKKSGSFLHSLLTQLHCLACPQPTLRRTYRYRYLSPPFCTP